MWGELQGTFETLRFGEGTVDTVCQILSAVLAIGNIRFRPPGGDDDGDDDASEVVERHTVVDVADLLKLPSADALEDPLTHRYITTRGDGSFRGVKD